MDENTERLLDGICHRFSNNFSIEDDRVLIEDRKGAKQKSSVISRKISERQITCFVNPLDDGSYEIKITDNRR